MADCSVFTLAIIDCFEHAFTYLIIDNLNKKLILYFKLNIEEENLI